MQPNQSSSKWGAVLTALFRANRFLGPAEIADLSGQDLDTVTNCLAFLLQQGWIEQLADAEKYACLYDAKAVLQSLESSKALEK
jgi:DNA-binding IclR family transcriptional regulator